MLAFCREVDRNSGKIAVYAMKARVTDDLLRSLSIRSRVNPELRYFVTTEAHWDDSSDVIIATMKRKNVSEAAIQRIGGIVEL